MNLTIWTIDSFPTLRDFCRKHGITFTLTYSFFARIYKFVFKERWVFVRSFDEHQLDILWLPGLEKELIDAIKKEFNIYDTAVEAHEAMREAELWGVFNKPLDKPWFPHIEPSMFYDKALLKIGKDDEMRDAESEFIKERKAWLSYNYLINANVNANAFVKIGKEDDEMKRKEMIAVPKGFGNFQMVGIKKVIFNDPATIVIWGDDVKTVVKAENEPYDPEKGMAMAIAKRALGNEGNYYDIFKKWLPKEEKKEPEVIGKIKDMTVTDSGVVVKAEITDEDFSNVIKEVSKY